MPEHGENQEREQQMKEVFESLLKGQQESRAAQQEGGEAWLEDRIAELPERAQGETRTYDQKLIKAGIANPALRAELVEEKIVSFEQTYQDRRFTVGEGEHMLNKGYAKEQAISHLKEILGDSPTPEDLKKVALLNFDANGLKAANDLSASHEKGTEYLKRIAEVYYAKDSAEAKMLKEMGIDEILPVTAGGDEYSILIKSEKPIPPEVVDKAIKMYEAAVARLDVSDIVDFNDDKTLLRYAGVTDKQFELMGEDERRQTVENVRKEMPPGFKMRASAPGGGATLYDGMLSALEHSTKPLSQKDNFGRAVDKIVGGMWDAADKPALENKNLYKESLRTQESSTENKFYSKVLARSSEARVMESRLDEMTAENAKMKLQIEKTQRHKKDMVKLKNMYKNKEIDAVAYANAQEIITEAWESEDGSV